MYWGIIDILVCLSPNKVVLGNLANLLARFDLSDCPIAHVSCHFGEDNVTHWNDNQITKVRPKL